MFLPFTVEQATRIAFGEGRIDELANDARAVAGQRPHILLIADRGVTAAGLVDRALAALARRRYEAVVHAELEGEPTAAAVDVAAEVIRRSDARLVIALGGGSALDLGKLAAAIASADQPAVAYALAARALPPAACPVICVPTTAGTGAEVTRTAVYSGDDGHQVWAWGEQLRPRLAVLDPALTAMLPAPVTATSGLDALVHGIEAATSRNATAISDAHALHAIRLAVEHLPQALERPGDLRARAGMIIAACLAGLAIDAAGAAIAHALGHALGSAAGVPHGRAVALALRVALAWNAEASPRRHGAVAEAMGVAGAADDAEMIARVEGRYDAVVRAAGIDVDLRRDGLGPADADRLIELTLARACRPMLEANARPVTRPAVARLVEDLLAAR